MKVPIEDVEEKDDLEVVVYQHDDDSGASAEESEFNGCIRISGETNLTPSVDRAQLVAVRCTLAQPKQVNDLRRTAIFQTCTKIWNKSCKVIMTVALISLR